RPGRAVAVAATLAGLGAAAVIVWWWVDQRSPGPSVLRSPRRLPGAPGDRVVGRRRALAERPLRGAGRSGGRPGPGRGAARWDGPAGGSPRSGRWVPVRARRTTTVTAPPVRWTAVGAVGGGRAPGTARNGTSRPVGRLVG